MTRDKSREETLLDKIDVLHAEVERLEAAFKAIANLYMTSPVHPFLADDMDRIARAALEPKP